MQEILLNIHHYVAFLALALLVFATVNGLMGTLSDKTFTDSHKKVNSFAVMATHIMLLLGIGVLIMTLGNLDLSGIMKNAEARKTYVEHPTMNIIAAVLVTIGSAKAKRGLTDKSKFKATLIFFGLALLLILSRLPFEKLF